jgi:hypothetical protein
MRPNDESRASPWEDRGQAAPKEAAGPVAHSGDDGGFLGRFPEAVAAGALADASPRKIRGRAAVFRIVLYSSLAVGAVAGGSLIAAWLLQAVLTGSYIRSGRDYFGSGVEAMAARELLSLPVGGFVAVLLACLVGMCIGVWGVQRARRE